MSVIGILNTVGSSGARPSTTADQDDQAIVPITTAATQLFGGATRNRSGRSWSRPPRRPRSRPPTRRPTPSCSACTPSPPPPMPTTPSPRRPPWSARHLGGQDPDRPPGRHRRHLATGRRHRGDEHHVGVRDRTDPRDRPPQGARGHAAGHPPPVPGGGVGPRSGRWDPGRGPRATRRLDPPRTSSPIPSPSRPRPPPEPSSSPWASGWPSASIRPAGPPSCLPSTPSAANDPSPSDALDPSTSKEGP